LYSFMCSITDSEHKVYQQNIIDFIHSKKFKKFHYNKFIEILTLHITKDIRKFSQII
jgi:hypothetical protein